MVSICFVNTGQNSSQSAGAGSQPDVDMPDDVNLPATWSCYGLTRDQYVALMYHSLPILARVGATLSRNMIRTITHASGVPASCSLLQDGAALYEEGLRFAMRQVWVPSPTAGVEDLSTTTPADAIRTLVRITYRRFQANPDALRLIISENLFGTAERTHRVGVFEESPVVLQLDRVLMRGHDVGAFRSGVSAEDLYILILSLCGFPVSVGSTFQMLYGMNVTDAANAAGMEALVQDAVLAFLTTHMPTSQGTSYTHSSLSPGVGSSVAASLYSNESMPSLWSRGLNSSEADYPDDDPYQNE